MYRALPKNAVNELRDVRAEDPIPRGYGPCPDIVGVYESGGTTGAPKRVVLLRDWHERSTAWMSSQLDAHGMPRNVDWLCVMPTGPHAVGMLIAEQVRRRGGLLFTVDLDPRWVKRLIAAGKGDEATAYAEHVVEQTGYLLRSQDIGVLMTTPPLLERIAGHDGLVEHQADSPYATQVNVELGFPCVWVAPWTREAGTSVFTNTLVLTAVTQDEQLLDELLADPTIKNLYLGNHPTYWMAPGIPHDAYLGEFLMRSKAVIRD